MGLERRIENIFEGVITSDGIREYNDKKYGNIYLVIIESFRYKRKGDDIFPSFWGTGDLSNLSIGNKVRIITNNSNGKIQVDGVNYIKTKEIQIL